MKAQTTTMDQVSAISVAGDTLFLRGDVSFASVAELARQSNRLPLDQVRRFNCAGISQSDSAAVSLLLYLMQGRDIQLDGVSVSLQGLLDLYGVTAFFNRQLSE